MDLNKESNAQLLNETKNLVSYLNEKTVEFLERLREIENRRLHLERGFSSLFAFVTEELGFSAAAAMRRINSMRLMKDLPEIKDQISTGVLNLTTVSQTQQFFKKESYSREEKLELLSTLKNKSTREVDKVLAKYSPEVIVPDRMKPVSLNQNEVKFIADDRLVEKLEKLKALRSHSAQTLSELLNAMADLCLEKWEPKVKVASNAKAKEEGFVQLETTAKDIFSFKAKTKSAAKAKLVTPAQKRYVSRKLKAIIYTRDQGRCQYTDSLTLKKCHSQHFVEIDHVEPFALGGKSSEENLRLYCSAHNQWRGQKTFGHSGFKISFKK